MDAAFNGWPVSPRNVGHHEHGAPLLVLVEDLRALDHAFAMPLTTILVDFDVKHHDADPNSTTRRSIMRVSLPVQCVWL